MPRTDTLTVAQAWTQLTNSDATAVTFQVKTGSVYIVATAGATPPTDFDNSLLYEAGQGEVALALADLAPGTAGANRLYAFAATPTATVIISHA
jgi:hypothetical protein